MTENASTVDDSNLDSVDSEEVRRASVTLFKPSGKYYTGESWRVPENAEGPEDMISSPDFKRIAGGQVLVESEAHSHSPEDKNWGVPHIL